MPRDSITHDLLRISDDSDQGIYSASVADLPKRLGCPSTHVFVRISRGGYLRVHCPEVADLPQRIGC